MNAYDTYSGEMRYGCNFFLPSNLWDRLHDLVSCCRADEEKCVLLLRQGITRINFPLSMRITLIGIIMVFPKVMV